MAHAVVGWFTVLMGLAGCAAPCGRGTGRLVTSTAADQPVTFTWSAADPTSGVLTATLPDGVTYVGRYEEDSAATTGAANPPPSDGWPAWPSVAAVGAPPNTPPADRVRAELQAGDGARMRCRFLPRSPSSGILSGGRGRCQLRSGGVIEAMLQPR
jgi:hypothetical protein